MTAGSVLDALPTEELARLLADGPTDVERCSAAGALGRRGGDDATAALVARLQHRISSTVSDACADALAVIGAPALPALTRLAAERGAGLYAARALRQIGGPEAEKALAAYEAEKMLIMVEPSTDDEDGPWTPRWLSLSPGLAMVVCLALLMKTREGGPAFWAAFVAMLVVFGLVFLVNRKLKRRWRARLHRYMAGETNRTTDPEIAGFADEILSRDVPEGSHGDPHEGQSPR